MKIYFIRHGDPNYKDNCLTPLGHLQAEALGERILKSAVRPDVIYSSKYGRAVETAEHTANKLGMNIEILDFMHEISTGVAGQSDEQKKYNSPWEGSPRFLKEGTNLATVNPDDCDIYSQTRFRENDLRVTEGFDAWMETEGYIREGLCYRCTRENKKKLFIYAHGGSISCLLGHFLGTNAIHACCMFRINCTGITEVEFKSEEGELVIPKISRVNDHSHIVGLKLPEENTENVVNGTDGTETVSVL